MSIIKYLHTASVNPIGSTYRQTRCPGTPPSLTTILKHYGQV